jgi:hypothetical protein
MRLGVPLENGLGIADERVQLTRRFRVVVVIDASKAGEKGNGGTQLRQEFSAPDTDARRLEEATTAA